MPAQFHPSIGISRGDATRCAEQRIEERIEQRIDLRIDHWVDLWLVGIFLLAACTPAIRSASIPHPHHQPRRIVRIIERMEQQAQKAELTGNTVTLAAMLSDDYLGIYSDGTLATKAETLKSLKDGSTHFSEISIFDRKIRVFGSTAVVTSKARV
ncbi:MAG: nuclear transport factor 2 family protein, partial [Acidobacteriaceae bacterium]